MPIASFISGLVFGLGLIVAGMADPAKVLGFLDLAGPWNPSLAFVMIGAIVLGVVGFGLAKRRRRSLLGAPMMLPTATAIDPGLIIGGLAFGAGWGLAGICPGPAFVLMGMGAAKGWVFGVAMLGGMALFAVLEPGRRRG